MKNQRLIAYAILAVCLENLLDLTKMWQHQQEPKFWINEAENAISPVQNGPEYVEQPV